MSGLSLDPVPDHVTHIVEGSHAPCPPDASIPYNRPRDEVQSRGNIYVPGVPGEY